MSSATMSIAQLDVVHNAMQAASKSFMVIEAQYSLDDATWKFVRVREWRPHPYCAD